MESAAIKLWVWYNFNILGITAIVFLMLAIILKRASQTIINTSERPYRPDNTLIKLAVKVGAFGILFFALREWGSDLKQLTDQTYGYVRGYFG